MDSFLRKLIKHVERTCHRKFTSDEMISIIDENGIIQYASESHVWLLGYTPDEMVGQCAADHVHIDDRDETVEKTQRIVRLNQIETVHFRIRHKNGDWIKFQSEGIPINIDDKNYGFVAVSRISRVIDLQELIAILQRPKLH